MTTIAQAGFQKTYLVLARALPLTVQPAQRHVIHPQKPTDTSEPSLPSATSTYGMPEVLTASLSKALPLACGTGKSVPPISAYDDLGLDEAT